MLGKIDGSQAQNRNKDIFSVLAAGKAMRLDEMTQEERAIEREKTETEFWVGATPRKCRKPGREKD